MFRRVLLGATTALLTARVLAPGEDPGMLQPLSGPANLLLPLCWFLAAVGLAVWRLRPGRGAWRGGAVEAALLLAALLAFVAAETAGYKHPARLIAWDGLTLFLVVCLVRQLAASPGDQQALFAVLLAGAAALSAQAVYQAAALRSPASATFAQAGPFAGFLALSLPGLLAAVYVCRPGRAPAWQTVLTALFGLLGAVAFIAALASAFAPDATTPPLPELWGAARKMIAARPWLGVGPGNFSRAFPRFQAPGGTLPVADPHNFVLETAATGGVFVLLAVLTALGAFFAAAARGLFRKTADGPGEAEPEERTRWEFYVGGMCGLVLGFVIRQSTGQRSPDEILTEGLIACARCLVWLTAFVLFERVAWSGRVRVGALAAGVAASLLVLLANPGFGLPSVAAPLWAAVALALNGLPQSDFPRVNRLALTRILPVPVTALVALLYFLDVFLPATSCADSRRQAVLAGEAYFGAMSADYLNKRVLGPLREAAKNDPYDAGVHVLLAQWTGELWAVVPAGDVDMQLAVSALLEAKKAEDLDPQGPDGYDAAYRLRTNFARRLGAQFKRQGTNADPALAASVGPGYRLFFDETRWPHPLGRGAIEALKQKYREIAKDPKGKDVNPNEPAIQYLEAADVLEKYLPNDPNDAQLRYLLAETLFKAWEDDRCREQATEALRLDAASARPPLTDDQRQRLDVWKDLPPG